MKKNYLIGTDFYNQDQELLITNFVKIFQVEIIKCEKIKTSVFEGKKNF